MGTRGFVGFVAEGREAITYNHFDSYPDGVGTQVLAWLRAVVEYHETTKVQAAVSMLQAVTDDSPPPNREQLEHLRQYTDLNVDGKPQEVSWYQALRGTQGNPQAILNARYYEDAKNFPQDSLFCEWGYLVDLDALTFEIYRGFQKEEHRLGRFAERDASALEHFGGPYYPVALIATWPLNALPSEENFLSIDRPEEDEE